MTAVLVDTSVLIKWFHSEGEAELAPSRAIRDGAQRGDVEVRILDLAIYEVGNVLLRVLGWRPVDVADQLDDLRTICGVPLVMSQRWLRSAADLGHSHNLTFCDAAWAAAAVELHIPLVSADRSLLAAGLAEPPSTFVKRLRL